MEQAIEKLNFMLVSEIQYQPGMLLDMLEELALEAKEAAPEELAKHDLDDIFVEIFPKLSKDEHKRFVSLLLDLIYYMRDPRNVYVFIEPYFSPGCEFSMDVACIVATMRMSLNFEFDSFFGNLFDSLSPRSIEEDTERRLFFLLTVFEDKSIPLSMVKPFIKKLCNISLQMDSIRCHKVLWAVLWIMRLHPMTYAMARSESFMEELEWSTSITMDKYQPYLFELDILSESLNGIKKVVKAIRNEAAEVRNRPKLISLASFAFPELKI